MIIDASVAVKWLVLEENSSEALQLIGRPDLLAPTLIQIEVGNAIWKKKLKGELADDPELSTLPSRLSSIIETEDETPLVGRALELAIALDHPIYDCIYLAMAEARDDELLTSDTRFLKRLRQAGRQGRVRPLA